MKLTWKKVARRDLEGSEDPHEYQLLADGVLVAYVAPKSSGFRVWRGWYRATEGSMVTPKPKPPARRTSAAASG